MQMTRRLRSWRFQFRLRTLLLVVTFLSLYLGSYLALRRPIILVEESIGGLIVSGRREPDYRFARPVCRIIFGPIAWLDCRLRPEYWGPYSEWADY